MQSCDRLAALAVMYYEMMRSRAADQARVATGDTVRQLRFGADISIGIVGSEPRTSKCAYGKALVRLKSSSSSGVSQLLGVD
jgi:hypothetical protein